MLKMSHLPSSSLKSARSHDKLLLADVHAFRLREWGGGYRQQVPYSAELLEHYTYFVIVEGYVYN